MKRKMLISIALITIMLLNCVMPLFVVNAAEGEEIQLNSNLYKAVKASLDTQGIKVTATEVTHTLTLSEAQKASIKTLNLNEGSISDLTGLDAFSSLEHLELSGNNLTKSSNLGVLNNLPNLNYLDLSTNKLDDISEIRGLIDTLRTKGTVILSGQNVMSVQTVYVDTDEESDNAEKANFNLPTILELAGYIKSCWKSTRSVKETPSSIAPYISVDSIPMYVSQDEYQIEVNISSEEGTPYYGMLEVVIYIYDDPTEAASLSNPNKAASNILNGSKFTLYFVVYDKSSEAITTMDTNLYYAIKEQLTAGQTKNPELASYPFKTDTKGNIIYEEFTYEEKQIQSKPYRVLTNVESKEKEYIYDYATKTLYRYKDTDVLGDIVRTTVEETVISTPDAQGTLTSKAGYRIAFVGEDSNTTLYIQAYDDAKTFVINDLVLTNKITSLILNNKQIRDLSGIEHFVGLSSKLNVSHNYLSDIDPLYSMEEQKAFWESQIIEKYVEYLKTRSYGNLSQVTKETEDARKEMKENEKAITDAYTRVLALLADAADVDVTKEKYLDEVDNKATSVNKILDEIYGYTNEQGEYVPGYKDLIEGYEGTSEGHVDGNIEKVNEGIQSMYAYLAHLYLLYNNEYKLTSLLSVDMNYETYDEYKTYEDKTKESTDSAKELLQGQIEFLKKLETEGALSDLDKALLSSQFGISFDDSKEEKPVAKYFDDYLKDTPLTRTEVVKLLKVFREIGLYSEMANYCLIKRMNEDTATGYCYEEEYLEKRINALEIEEIPATLEEDVLKSIQTGSSYSKLYNEYRKYEDTNKDYTNVNLGQESDKVKVYLGKDEYREVNSLVSQRTNYTKSELIENAVAASKSETNQDSDKRANVTRVLDKIGTERANGVVKSMDLYETVKVNEKVYKSELNSVMLYNQMMSLAKKLLNGDTDKYIKLPRLKDLNVSYNADLNNIERITELQSLYTLDASYCYIADVDNIDWSKMENLKRLYLGYNFISDMSALTNLPNIKELDLSNNLLSGKLDITEQQYLSVFKNMEKLNLSGNQISDVESLLIYLDYISGGNYANYLAREDTVDIDLRNQNIELVIREPININEYPTTINVELPKIFKQLQKIDTERTSFGETSQRGRVEFEGSYVTLNTRTTGDKVGTVVVIAQTGDNSPVTTCVGEGTTATIYYTVVDGEKLPVNPDTNTNTNTENPPVDPDTNTNTNTTPVDPDTNTENPPVDPNTNTNTTPVDPEVPSVNTENLGYTEGEEYVTEILAKTPVEDFKEVLLNGLTYKVQVTSEEDGEEVTTGYMKTGMYVKVLDQNGNVIKDQNGDLVVYQVVVKGDINGDGYADASDSILIKSHRAEVKVLEGAQFAAGDINEDGHVDVLDSKLLLYHRAEVSGYDLNFVK